MRVLRNAKLSEQTAWPRPPAPRNCYHLHRQPAEGNERCQMAIDMWSYRVASQFATMVQAMNGVDTMVFTAGVGENSAHMRKEVVNRLAWMGVKIDDDKNAVRSDDPREISTPDSGLHVWVIPTNEELMIALDVKELLGK